MRMSPRVEYKVTRQVMTSKNRVDSFDKTPQASVLCKFGNCVTATRTIKLTSQQQQKKLDWEEGCYKPQKKLWKRQRNSFQFTQLTQVNPVPHFVK